MTYYPTTAYAGAGETPDTVTQDSTPVFRTENPDRNSIPNPDKNWTALSTRGAQLYYEPKKAEEGMPTPILSIEKKSLARLLDFLAKLTAAENEDASTKAPYGALGHIPSIVRCINALKKAKPAEYTATLVKEINKLKRPGDILDHGLAVEFARQVLNRISFYDEESADKAAKENIFLKALQKKYPLWNQSPTSPDNLIRAYSINSIHNRKNISAIIFTLEEKTSKDIIRDVIIKTIPDDFKLTFALEYSTQETIQADLKAMGMAMDEAAYALGFSFLCGRSPDLATKVTQDYGQAVKHLTTAADLGNTNAQVLLGKCYQLGQTEERRRKPENEDHYKACFYFRKAMANPNRSTRNESAVNTLMEDGLRDNITNREIKDLYHYHSRAMKGPNLMQLVKDYSHDAEARNHIIKGLMRFEKDILTQSEFDNYIIAIIKINASYIDDIREHMKHED